MLKLCTIVVLLSAASTAWSQDGGKLPWRGKTENPKTALADARSQGRPSMLFFTSLGCGYCKVISNGAFSNAEVVEAASGLVCIFVDCDWGKKNEELANEFRVTGYPTVAFCDPSGKDIGRLQGREIPDVLREIREIVRKYPAGPAPAGAPSTPAFQEYSPTLLRNAAPKPVLLFFYDLSQASDTINRSLSDPGLRDLRNRFVLAQTEYKKGSELSTRCDVLRAPTLLLLDPAREKAESQPLGRISGSRSPRELQRDLEELLGGAASTEARPNGPSPDAPRREEPLSDDDVDRKFIQARISIALDASKRGKKAKAIEILEDVLQSYPKHVLTRDVKDLLDSLKK